MKQLNITKYRYVCKNAFQTFKTYFSTFLLIRVDKGWLSLFKAFLKQMKKNIQTPINKGKHSTVNAAY